MAFDQYSIEPGYMTFMSSNLYTRRLYTDIYVTGI